MRRQFTWLLTLAASLCLSTAQATVFWTGAVDTDYDTADNWDSLAVPDRSEEIEVEIGTPVRNGNWDRAAQSDFTSSGSLTVNGRLLNANGGDATINWNSTGTLTHNGDYFIVGTNSTGAINQSSGTVDATINRGFFLSDGGGVKGTYHLTGGELNVHFTGYYNSTWSNEFIGRNGDDLFHVDGGTASFSTASSDRRLYMNNDSQLLIDSGSFTADDFQYFILGRDETKDGTPTVTINGGELNANMASGTAAFIVGAAQDGLLEINGGSLTITGNELWIGDGLGQGIVNQTGGDVLVDGYDIYLGRGGDANSDEYNMSGGTLTASNLVMGSDTSAVFHFTGGEIYLLGDDRSVVNESWFVASPNAQAFYDASTDMTTITIVPEPTSIALAGLLLAGGLMVYRRK
ncbi:PEP-CTERM sorting domain-containing protein [Aeoliella mucimassa]|uniref:Ice-binding protein C-terminal domain-containing protein n=1 Tax=Aeoliella mucimassa TaxID=2527972 RepID=A0A518ALC0_9BACT|nr:PEP-CTERM sorting domain-containing protein [Aeoliella mucimassa]QDU55525.1 hypothetical protein Pan181_17170 [Aeoliella mucimassa]